MFKDYSGFHSEFHALETTRHTQLTDKFCLRYFELPKLPLDALSKTDRLKLWLALFKAKTEEDLKQIEELGVDEMQEAIQAYKTVAATSEFKEVARLRERARFNEASALRNAERKGRRERNIEIARKLISRGRPIEEIMEDTGLTHKEIERLQLH